MSAPRILLRVDGDHAIGLGHVVRMRSLAEVLAGQGAHVILLTRGGTSGEVLLRRTDLPVLMLERGDAEEVAAAAASAAPDVVVVDALDTTSSVLSALRGDGRGRRLITFDDTAAGLTEADAVINPIVFHWGRYRPEDCRARLFEGPDYMILSRDMTIQAAQAPQMAERVRRVLLAFGGTDTRGLTGRVLEALAGVPGPLTLHVNLGPGAHPAPDLQAQATASPHHVTLMQGCPSFAAECAAADLVLCAGGVMLYELAALGIPAAAIAAEDHEAVNIAYWAGQGSVVDLGHHAAFDAKRVRGAVEALIPDAPWRRRLSERGRALVDGQGLERCLRVVLNTVAQQS